MNKLNQLASFFLLDAIENNYSAEEVEVTVRLQYEPIIADLILTRINEVVIA